MARGRNKREIKTNPDIDPFENDFSLETDNDWYLAPLLSGLPTEQQLDEHLKNIL
jgi:hypothetical protein